MATYDKTALWQRALGAQVNDVYAYERERLRQAFESARKRAQPLADSIAQDFPDFTVHDITHSDALWEYADLIGGPNYPINACEAFVLGCAFLVHDLGMGLAAYPDGMTGLKSLNVWKDTVAALLFRNGADEISDDAIESADAAIQRAALTTSLRLLHADRAQLLALAYWQNASWDERYYFIEDAELRTAFGPLIGRIAASHWWSIDQVSTDFAVETGAPTGFPDKATSLL